MNFNSLINTGRKDQIKIDRNPFPKMTEEEIEKLLEEMTEQGYLIKSDKGYSLTKKGEARGRLAQMIDFFK